MAMPPLYKRYIPPKSSSTSTGIGTAAAALPSVLAASRPPIARTAVAFPPPPPPPVVEKKRKRDRPEEEVAERKAKKLRKKGVEATAETVLEEQKLQRNGKKDARAGDVDGAGGSLDGGDGEVRPGHDGGAGGEDKAGGDGPGKMNMKKRHKLEKGARKARREAEKAGEVSGDVDAQANGQAGAEDLGGEAVNGSEHMDATVESPEAPIETAHMMKERKKLRKTEADNHGQDDGPGETVSEQTTVASTSIPKRKSVARAEQEQSEATPQAPQDDNTVVSSELPAPETKPPGTKKRRHKLEAVLQQADPGAEEGAVEEDDHLRNHGTVLDRYAKAAKRSQDVVPPGQDGTVDPAAELPILRDLAPLPQPQKAPTPDFQPNYS
ncbi:ATP-dependent RNA helicase dbp6, partial [Teratosphaeriaceae sp. CCFEE 6253]